MSKLCPVARVLPAGKKGESYTLECEDNGNTRKYGSKTGCDQAIVTSKGRYQKVLDEKIYLILEKMRKITCNILS